MIYLYILHNYSHPRHSQWSYMAFIRSMLEMTSIVAAPVWALGGKECCLELLGNNDNMGFNSENGGIPAYRGWREGWFWTESLWCAAWTRWFVDGGGPCMANGWGSSRVGSQPAPLPAFTGSDTGDGESEEGESRSSTSSTSRSSISESSSSGFNGSPVLCLRGIVYS